MKVDKDQLLKHHFWIVVGLSVPVALVAILLLVTSVRGTTEDMRKKLEEKLKTVKQNPKTPEEVAKKQVEADYLVKKETDAWAKAFGEQASLLHWPRKIETTYHFADGLFANEVHLIKVPADKGEWPADKAGQLQHGMLVFADDSKFEIVAKDGKERFLFYATPRLNTKGGIVDDRPDAKEKDLVLAGLASLRDTAVAVTYQKSRYFNDKLTYNEQSDYKKTYLSQIPRILRIVDPVRMAKDEDGKPYLAGVVQLRTGSGTFDMSDDQRDYDEIPDTVRSKLIPPDDVKFLRFLAKEWDIKNDISEEAWIAQEDLWIQTEIYQLIHAANESLSAFDEVPGKRDNKARKVVYRNAYFEIGMQLADPTTLVLEIANQLNRRQKIETMKVRVQFTDPKTVKNAEPEVFPVVTRTKDADPLEPKGDPNKGDRRKITVKLKQGPRRDGIFGLAQVLTWETAAVKRIDQVSIGAGEDISLSQKGMSSELQPYKPKPKDEKPAADDKSGAGGSGAMGAMGAMGGKGMGVGMGAGNGLGAGGKGADVLANGLVPDRYLEVTPQFRRVPVGVVLIVDQNHVDRVLTAFNNSKLRFLMTQVLINHYARSVKPDLASDKTDEGSAPPGGPPAPGSGGPAFPGGSGLGKFGPGMPGRPMGGSGGFPPGGKMPTGGGFGPLGGGMDSSYGHAAAVATDDLEANMELVIYGIVTLYERYPPRPAAGGAAPGSETAKAP